MQRNILVLTALLAAQLALAAGISLTGPELGTTRPDAPLLDVDTSAVDRVRIEGPDGAEVVLARDGDGWVLPETSGGFPAAEGNVERMLDTLGGLRRGFAVATSDEARSRFRVTENDFERRVTLFTGETALATLYIGTSAGANQTHARPADEDGVYLVDFGAFDAPAESGDWQDETTLQIPREQIDSIAVGDLTLSRVEPEAAAGEDGAASGESGQTGAQAPAPDAEIDADSTAAEAELRWRLSGGAPGESVNEANADTLAMRIAQLRTGDVLGTEARDEYGLDEPVLELAVVGSDGERVEYTLGRRAEAEDYVLKSSARPEYFALGTTTAERLVDAASREQLVETPGEDAEEAGDGAAGAETPAPDGAPGTPDAADGQ